MSYSVSVADKHAVHKYTQLFTYDELGNVLTQQHTTPDEKLNRTRSYIYAEQTNYLLKHDKDQTLNDYEYDAHGNITKMPHL
jgi:hypothetical protein